MEFNVDNHEFSSHLFAESDEVTAMIMPVWPSLDHRWVQKKYESQFEEQGYIDALDYYNSQIDFWQIMISDFEEGFKKEAAKAKETFLSQTLN